MNYSKLVSKLRQSAYNYKDNKEIQHKRILKEAIKRKIEQRNKTDIYKSAYTKRQEKLLFLYT